MRTLVTGGAGFIGSNLVDALLARGDGVTVVDDLSTGRRENLDAALAAGAELAELDVREGAELAELAAAERPEVVFHLAAQIDVRKSLADPVFDAAVNVGGTANVLEAAREAGSRVVFVSTGGAIYGEGEGKELPLGEGAPIEPFSAYGQSKYAAEGYLALYERLYGLSGVSLRLGNVYGPRQDPLGEAGVIAIFCGQASGRRAADRLRRRQADPRLHIRRRRGRRDARPRRSRGPAARSTSARGWRPTCSSWQAGWARWAAPRTSSPSSPRPGPARCSGSRSTRRGPQRELGWRAETGLEEGLRLTLGSL